MARLLKKKIGGLNLGPMGLNQAQNEVFPHLYEFGSYVFLEIAYKDSLLQCLTYSRGKIHKKRFEAQIWAKWAKSDPKFVFSSFSQAWFINFILKCIE